MSTPRDALLGLIHTLYAAPGGQVGWMTFLRELCLRTQSVDAHFISVSSAHRATINITTVENPQTLVDYQRQWGAHDPWGQSSRLLASPGQTVILGQEIVQHTALTRTDYYAEFARPYDLARVAVGVVERQSEGVSVVSLNRSERQPDFDRPEALFLKALMPHLRRGLQLHARLLSSEKESADLATAVHTLPGAVLLLSAAGHVTFMNDAASSLLQRRDGVMLDRGELRVSDRVANESLRRAIADAARTTMGEGLGAGDTVLLHRPSGRRPLRAVVSPVSRPHLRMELSAPDSAVAMVVISDPDSVAMPDQDLLRVLFHLTPAESELARRFARGTSVAEAAGQLGLSRETIRKRLKAIFEKTGTSRQSELVVLLLKTARLSAPNR